MTRRVWVATAVILLLVAVLARRYLIGASQAELFEIPPPTAGEVRALPEQLGVPDSMLGKSRALRFRAVTAAEAIRVPGFLELKGELAIRKPGAHPVPLVDGSTFSYFVMRPFGEKRGEILNGYRLGRWPAEQWIMSRNYFNPDGFVEVTPENASVALTPHFRLGDFVTHDQRDRWPKYVVLEEKLFDKLELVLQELNRQGIATGKVVLLSGFRAPYYNQRGAGEGMARGSRHQYGDAADVIIDDNGDGRMDDLNGNKVSDLGDTAPIALALNRVERAHPELVGGLGTYSAMGPSGPFVHIDVRGNSARWERRNR